MADLPEYKNLDSKANFFSNGDSTSFVLNTKNQLDKWFQDVELVEDQESKVDATALIYRGMKEAKYKILSSAQRLWIMNEMSQWSSKSYMDFINDLVTNANKNALISKVFDLYNYSITDREFPILSLLQHYGAPTPLMDWSYNQNVAFFFATEELHQKKKPKQKIDNYFSIYRINKRKYKEEFLNVTDIFPGTRYPQINSFSDFGDKLNNANSNSIFYISDFERPGESKGSKKPYGKLIIRTSKPYTSIYNQNIIPQEGLFIFNPFSTKTLEEIFNVDQNKEGWNHALTSFECFNIHKDLAEYLRRKIDVRYKINKGFIYPILNTEAKKIKNATLNGLV